VFLKSLFCQKNNVPRIDTPGAHKNALAAQHAFLYLFPYMVVLAAFKQDMDLSQAKTCKVACGTGGGASSALNTEP